MDLTPCPRRLDPPLRPPEFQPELHHMRDHTHLTDCHKSSEKVLRQRVYSIPPISTRSRFRYGEVKIRGVF